MVQILTIIVVISLFLVSNVYAAAFLEFIGGTGETTFTTGDLLAGDSSSGLTKLSIGSNGLVLTASSTATTGLSWESIPETASTTLDVIEDLKANSTIAFKSFDWTIDTTGASSTLFIDGSGGNVLIGHNTALLVSNTSPFQILGTSGARASMIMARFTNTAGSVASYNVLKSRSGTIGNFAIVQDNDSVGRFKFLADDGIDYNTQIALFEAEVDDANPAGGVIGGALIFSTGDGTNATPVEAMRLDTSQRLFLGTAGIIFSQDGDGALTITGNGDGSDEDFTINLDDTANTGVWTSSTGLNKFDFAAIGLELDANVNLTLGAETLDHNGTDFVFSDSISVSGILISADRINDFAGAYLGVVSNVLDLDTEVTQRTIISDWSDEGFQASSTNFADIDNAITIQEVGCYGAVGASSTIQIEWRSQNTPTTASATNILSAELESGGGTNASTTSFATSVIDADSVLAFITVDASSSAAFPDFHHCYLNFKVND